MKRILLFALIALISASVYSQSRYDLRADTVRALKVGGVTVMKVEGAMQIGQSIMYNASGTAPTIGQGFTLGTISSDQTITFVTLESGREGTFMFVANQNTSEFVWQVIGPVYEGADGSAITSLSRGLHLLRWNGSEWIRLTIGGIGGEPDEDTLTFVSPIIQINKEVSLDFDAFPVDTIGVVVWNDSLFNVKYGYDGVRDSTFVTLLNDGVNIYNSNGTLESDRTVSTTSAFALTVTGDVPSSTKAGTLIGINNHSSGRAISGSSSGSGGVGVIGSVTTGTGVNGTASTSGVGVAAQSSSGTALTAQSTSGSAGQFTVIPSSTNSIVQVGVLQRLTSGTAANGIGGSLDFTTQTTGIGQISNRLVSWWVDATSATRTSNFDIYGVSSASTQTFMNIQPTGIVRVNNLADTLATRAYARSVGGSGSTPTFQQVLTAGSIMSAMNNVLLNGNQFLFTGTSGFTQLEGEKITVSNTTTSTGIDVTVGAAVAGVFETEDSEEILKLRRTSASAATNNIGANITYEVLTTDGQLYQSNKLLSKWANATTASRTSHFDVTGYSSASLQTFMNIQPTLVRINNNADTLATQAYARANGGGGAVSSGTFASRPASPSVGQQYYQTDLLSGLYVYNGSRWVIQNDDSFLAFCKLLGNTYPFNGNTSGTGAATYQDSEKLSYWRVDAGTTTTGNARLHVSAGFATVASQLPTSGEIILLYENVYTTSLSDGTNTYVIRIGRGATGDDSGIYFKYTHSENSGQWTCITHDGTSATTTNTSVALATSTPKDFMIIYDFDGTDQVRFYIDNTLVATHTANLPTTFESAAYPFGIGIEKTAGTSNRMFSVDNIYIKQTVE